MEDARRSGSLEVPMHLRNAPTRLMQELGYGKRYRYTHDKPEGYAAGENYFPNGLSHPIYYAPADRGLEIRIREKLARLRELDRVAGSQKPAPADREIRRDCADHQLYPLHLNCPEAMESFIDARYAPRRERSAATGPDPIYSSA